MADIVTSTKQTFYGEQKNYLRHKNNHNSTANDGDTSMILNAGGDETLITYRDVVCESMLKQSEQLPALHEPVFQPGERSL